MIKKIVLLAVLMLSGCTTHQSLIISTNLKYEYDQPEKVLHTYNSLILKGQNWWVSHEVIDETRVYPNMDLGSEYKNFLRSIFIPKYREDLSSNLVEMSIKQAAVFGVDYSKVIQIHRGSAEIIAYFNQTENRGYMVIFDEALVHRFDLEGQEADFNKLIKGIKSR